MPLPWLIGAAVVAAAAAVVKAVSDDDSPSSSDSGEAERRRQEREARIQRKRDGLTAYAASLKQDRLAEARALLALSAETLAKLPKKTIGLNTSDFESALRNKSKTTSAYAESLSAVLDPTYGPEGISQQERNEFLINLQMLESLYGPIPFGSEEQRDLAELHEVGRHLDKLHNLKQQLEQQG